MNAADKMKVVQWINKVRGTTGGRHLQKIPRGVPGSHCACPLSKGTRLVIDGYLTRELVGGGELDDRRWLALIRSGAVCVGGTTDPDYRLEVPPFINRFITKFDAGKIPELVLWEGVPE